MNKNKELLENGWALEHHQLSNVTMTQLINQKDYFLELAETEVQKEFGIKWTIFEESKKEFIELTKAITRSLLRYDVYSIDLAKMIFQKLKNEFKLSSEINYCTLPYPIIHLPSDTSEAGKKHKDNLPGIEHFYTTWTPLNECFSQPLAITENTHKKNYWIFRKIRSRFKFVDTAIDSFKKTIKPDISIGEFIMWYGATDHEGLINKTDAVTTALVVRFTSSPIMYECSLPLSELEGYNNNDVSIDANQVVKKFIYLFKEISKQAEQGTIEKMPLASIFQFVDDNIKTWSLSSGELKRFSFMLTLWAQRLEIKKDVTLFYLYALNCAQDNLQALNKSLTYVLNKYDLIEVEQFINRLIKEKTSIQTQYIIKNVISLYPAKAKELNIEYAINPPLLKW